MHVTGKMISHSDSIAVSLGTVSVRSDLSYIGMLIFTHQVTEIQSFLLRKCLKTHAFIEKFVFASTDKKAT